MLRRASRICCVGTWRRFSHLRRPLNDPNWISSVSIAPYSVSNLKLATSSRLTPISWRHSSKRPTQSLKVPILATFPGIKNSLTTEDTEEHEDGTLTCKNAVSSMEQTLGHFALKIAGRFST